MTHSTTENPMVVGLAEALEAHYPQGSAIAWEYAEREALCNVDELTSFFSGECISRKADDSYIGRVKPEALDVASLLGALMVCDADRVAEYRDELRKRYLSENQGYVFDLYAKWSET